MRSWLLVALACRVVLARSPVPPGQHFQLLRGIVDAPVAARLLSLESDMGGGKSFLACGHWCHADLDSVRLQLSDGLGKAPQLFSDPQLVERLVVSASPSEAGVAMVSLSPADAVQDATWWGPHGELSAFEWPTDARDAAVILPPGARVSFAAPVKLVLMPLLKQARPAWDYYIATGIWSALVSAHCTSNILGLKFFRAHTHYALFWHACVWSAIGALALILAGLPLFWKPLLSLIEAPEPFEKRQQHNYFSATKAAKSIEETKPTLPWLLPSHVRKNRSKFSEETEGTPGKQHPGSCSPHTPGTMRLERLSSLA